MKQFETRFKQVDVLPMVKHYMSSLDLYNLFKKYVPASNSCLAEHAESLCIITANIICDIPSLSMLKLRPVSSIFLISLNRLISKPVSPRESVTLGTGLSHRTIFSRPDRLKLND